MKVFRLVFAIAAPVFLHLCAAAATIRYVDANGTNPVPPYTGWATAATNIQDAIGFSGVNDTILVTNGIYQYGGDSFNGSNRVRAPFGAALKIQSINGPAVTIIKGYQVPGTTNGTSAVRCVYLSEFSSLSGFTLTGGATRSLQVGGGAVLESQCVLSNCIVTGNASDVNGAGVSSGNGSLVANCVVAGNTVLSGGGQGGGIYGCIVNDCVVSNNFAANGGGVYSCTVNDSLLTGNGNTNSSAGTSGGAAYNCTLNNCTLVGNYSHGFGAAEACNLNNTIIYYNVNGIYADCYQCRLTNCCTTVGVGNATLPNSSFSNSPVFLDPAHGNYRLQIGSPGMDAGTNIFAPAGTDLDGNPRIVGGTVDLGAYEIQNTNPVHYVSLGNSAPVLPFTNWLTAATNIQDAIDAASAGDFIVVSNGTYNAGGRIVYSTTTNRVVVDKAVTVQSVYGPGVTAIAGNLSAGVPNLNVRCAYLTNGATLIGFTLTDGGPAPAPLSPIDTGGGGAWCEGSSAVISNCVFSGNLGVTYGGGAFRGTLLNCVLTNNTGGFGGAASSNSLVNCTLIKNTASQQNFNSGGGASGCALSNCALVGNVCIGGRGGGGAYGSTLTGCVVSNNFCSGNGGGLSYCVAINTLISSNHANAFGGGAFSNVLNNCVLKNNLANSDGGGAYKSSMLDCTVVRNTTQGAGGGMQVGGATNCLVYYNSSPLGSSNLNDAVARYCDTTPIPTGAGNITNEPAFVDLANGDFHLQSNSPCINAGNNAAVSVAVDFDGNPRLAGGTVDIGAYEFSSPSSAISYAWLQRYGLPADGSADSADADGDGMSSYAEWITGTNPTNALSCLKMTSAAPTNNFSSATITWQSVTGVNYTVQRSSDFSVQPPFSTIATNLAGKAGTTSYTDLNAIGNGPFFYRVGVSQ